MTRSERTEDRRENTECDVNNLGKETPKRLHMIRRNKRHERRKLELRSLSRYGIYARNLNNSSYRV